ncbi:hypothetical protein [Lederbergia lenta]|uniref:hypothetical protein n=1 Tax=Lederbergia lenta TaxID=1467 RepID=UPI00203AC4FC|nr:hypothetical protein [Lederbergia lenta]MCM3110667.1 hypothetical protein [Lederbergia lenta]
MNLPLNDQLKVWKQDHAEMKQQRKLQKRKREVLTDSDIKSLMGVNRPTYARYKGSYRQR